MNQRFIPQRVTPRSFVVLLLYAVAFFCAYTLAFCIPSNFSLERGTWILFWLSLVPVLLVKLAVFYTAGHCHQSWRYVTFSDLAGLMWSTILSTLIIVTLDHFLVDKDNHIPRTILFLDWLLTLVFVGAIRAFWRLIREEFRPLFYGEQARKALIIGANQSSEALARYVTADNRLKYRIVGFLDSDPSTHGSLLSGVPVLGDWQKAPYFAEATGAVELLVVSDYLSGKELRVLMDGCRQEGLNLKVMPALDDLLEGNYAFQIRDVEINDLLRRDPVELNNEAIRTLLEGQCVMITGAGGSIGSEICRQVLKFHPRELVLVEQAENSLFYVEQELRRLNSATVLHPCIADITDPARIEQVFVAYHPRIVFHAAAHKHVPMMESNPGEAIKNNVLGTKQLAELADKYGVHEFVMISTDKAVNPTSVMGVSKQLAERYIHAFSETARTKFVAVRFGNVLASAGSVVPIFQDQIRRGGPITVTHPEIERYFMTIPEASQLVLQAATMGKGGEIFVLDMGESVRIVDLARDLIRLSGLAPDDIEIVFTGLRPGEKLYEELYFDDEEMLPTPHDKVFVAYHRPYQLEDVRRSIGELAPLVHAPAEVLFQKIRELVPEYQPSQTAHRRSMKTVPRYARFPAPNAASQRGASARGANSHGRAHGLAASPRSLLLRPSNYVKPASIFLLWICRSRRPTVITLNESHIQIAGRKVGPGLPCLIVAEVAQAHDGSLGTAHAYVDAAARAGVDAIKFQTHIAAAESTPSEQFRVKFSSQDATRYDYWKRMEFSETAWRGLAEHARDRGLIFLSTPFSMEACDLLERLDVPAWKIGSGEVTNLPMIERLARTGRPVLLSSGMSPWEDLDRAVETVRKANGSVAVFQCTTAYPCPAEKIGLNVLDELRERYACPIGLSDHSGKPFASLAATALGANMLEVHLVFSRDCFGPDVPASLTIEELTLMVDGVRFIERALANPVDKQAAAAEMGELRTLFGKSIVAARDLPAGHVLVESDLALRKPGTGMAAARLPQVIGRRLSQPVTVNTLLSENYLD